MNINASILSIHEEKALAMKSIILQFRRGLCSYDDMIRSKKQVIFECLSKSYGNFVARREKNAYKHVKYVVRWEDSECGYDCEVCDCYAEALDFVKTLPLYLNPSIFEEF